MFKTTKHLNHFKATIHKQFREEFGIHFKDAAELRFVQQFLSDVIDDTIRQSTKQLNQ